MTVVRVSFTRIREVLWTGLGVQRGRQKVHIITHNSTECTECVNGGHVKSTGCTEDRT